MEIFETRQKYLSIKKLKDFMWKL
ncbi:CLUMA_CG003791, isoform A [Clunio marinus]|uniref:CLUMA_CG003791, isoform A n=1 Tax=Clunio marinus TaxID=568069 RepID=A0A1J1HPT8_9DIPT|nr:CLUMA_CG003791, isoform A [Clunio marinus]